MPALSADITAAMRDAAIDTQSSSLIKTWHPNARDTGAAPREGWYDDPADTAVMNAEGFGLLGVERRVFSVPMMGARDALAVLADLNTTPTVQLVDAEQQVNALFLVAFVEIDLEADSATLELFG